MSFYQNHSKNTLKKALHWLDEQDNNWTEHIKDSRVAVQMYLKSQKKEEEDDSFQKELKAFLKEPGAVSMALKKSPPAKTAPFLENSAKLPDTKAENQLKNKNTFSLDEKSQQALEQAKAELNLQSNEEALRLLIQLGQKSLKRL